MQKALKTFDTFKETIEYVDSLAFPKHPIPVELVASQKEVFIAKGNESKFFPEEGISCFLLVEELNFITGKKDVKSRIEDERYVINTNHADYVLLAAVHEVRHRAQMTEGSLLRGREMVKLRKLLWKVLKYDSYFHEHFLKRNFLEIDAILISSLAEWLKKEISEKDLAKLIHCDDISFLEKKGLI